jgi:hypothetical protein
MTFFEKTKNLGLLGRIKRPEKKFIVIIANGINQTSVLPIEAPDGRLAGELASIPVNSCKDSGEEKFLSLYSIRVVSIQRGHQAFISGKREIH